MSYAEVWHLCSTCLQMMVNSQYGSIMLKCTADRICTQKKYTHALFWTVLISVCDVDTHLNHHWPSPSFAIATKRWKSPDSRVEPPFHLSCLMTLLLFLHLLLPVSVFSSGMKLGLQSHLNQACCLASCHWWYYAEHASIYARHTSAVCASFLGSKGGSCRPSTRPVCAYCVPQTGQTVWACCQGGQDIAFLSLTAILDQVSAITSRKGGAKSGSCSLSQNIAMSCPQEEHD